MKSALSALRTQLAELRRHIGMMDIEWELLAASSASPPCSASDEIAERFRQHVGVAVAKRRFDYNCVIISLYGALEYYIEALARLYVTGLNVTVPKYVDLPQKILESHINLTYIPHISRCFSPNSPLELKEGENRVRSGLHSRKVSRRWYWGPTASGLWPRLFRTAALGQRHRTNGSAGKTGS
jgi:hypothetical protein